MTRQAVLLAAGRAHRLLPLTEQRPKGMLLVGGKPLLQYAVEALKEQGVEELVMVTGAHGEKIQSFFQDGARFGLAIRYAHQAEPTGTADALRHALPHLDRDAPSWVLSGHAYVGPGLLRPLGRAKATSLLVATAGDAHPQVVPEVNGDRLVGAARTEPVVGSTRVSTGLLVAGPDLLAALDDGLDGEDDLELALGAHAQAGGDVRTVATDAPWHVVVDPWHVLRLNERVLDGLAKDRKAGRTPFVSGAVHIGENTEVAPTATIVGPATLGEGCSIGDYTVIGPYVSIRNNTVVGAHCEVRRSILNNNVVVDSRGLVRGSILDDGVQVAPGFVCHEESTPQGPLGCILGRDTTVGPGVRLPGGTVLDPESEA